ncbi:MAG TPA: radical SAM protein [Bacillota bacterium]|nr:radical SAM protein [Bacillota bacterium]HOK68053.1 radical SAM protein [Bacillota bacterium]HPP85873.1 radical SAM protein [Bacillota bacterium]
MFFNQLYEKAQSIALKQVISYLDKDPDKNIPKILRWLEKRDKEHSLDNQIRTIRNTLNDKDNNWNKLYKSLWTDIDAGVRKKLFETFIINASLIGAKRQRKLQKKEKCNIPWAILMDPTSACNLHCIGCWAADYGNKLSMTFEQLDDIIRQGKELGIYMYIYSGGEPLVRKKDIIAMCEKHQDCAFLAFTNATLIDEQFADDMLRVKNFVPAISVEGFAEATDSRRGKGTYDAICKAMEILKRKKLPFGISCCYTSQNYKDIGSDAFFDDMIAKGAKFAWFFTYIPVGKDAVPSLMVTDEQREYMYHKIREFRNTKPLFTLDFWNDGEYVGGCIAGGRSYLHINANGDMEPCAFIHYSDSNIKDKTILEALKSPLFMQYYMNQPFNENMLRPCPLLDNPEMIVKMVEASGAKSTDMQSPEDVHELSQKCVPAAEKWAVTADKLWKCSPHYCSKCKPTAKTESKQTVA